jgi:hypothetical protein
MAHKHKIYITYPEFIDYEIYKKYGFKKVPSKTSRKFYEKRKGMFYSKRNIVGDLVK